MSRADSAPAAPPAETTTPGPARPLSETTVAVLGAGRMGSAMATRLAGQGAKVVVFNRTQSRAEDLADRIAARTAPTPAEAAAQADVLITMVADEDAVIELYRQPDGVLEGLSKRTVVADMSTVLPDTIRSLESDVRSRGAGILDAPVSGSVPLVEAGTLTILVGGDAADLERARPVFEAMSRRIFHLGPLGAGATVKLAVNDIVFVLGGALAEALVLAEKAGVKRSVAYDVFTDSTIGSPFVGYKRDAYVEPDRAPVGFSVDLARKDLNLILELARRVGAEMPQAKVSLAQLGETADELGGDRDFAVLAEHLRRGRAGMA
jgi:3-hydroxyisobutyrate dehydrogenase-like beta-hydroxyacid dehydrogenase